MSAFLSHERRAGFVAPATPPPTQAAFYTGSTIVSEATTSDLQLHLADHFRQSS